MPARNKTAGGGGGRAATRSPRSDGDDSEAYKLKRKRNNDAVKKTREKSKQTAMERKQNVEILRRKNTQMEAKIEEVKQNVEKLKDILLHKMDPSEHDKFIKKILDEPSEDEDDDD